MSRGRFDLDQRMIFLREREGPTAQDRGVGAAGPGPRARRPRSSRNGLTHRMDREEGGLNFKFCDCPSAFPRSELQERMDGRHGAGHRPLDQVKAAGERAGVQGLSFLSFRHSFATNAASWGLTPEMVKRVLRHTPIRRAETLRPFRPRRHAVLRRWDQFRPARRPRYGKGLVVAARSPGTGSDPARIARRRVRRQALAQWIVRRDGFVAAKAERRAASLSERNAEIRRLWGEGWLGTELAERFDLLGRPSPRSSRACHAGGVTETLECCRPHPCRHASPDPAIACPNRRPRKVRPLEAADSLKGSPLASKGAANGRAKLDDAGIA